MLELPEGWKALTATVATGLIGIAGWLLLSYAGEEPTERRLYLEVRIEHADEVAGQLARWQEATLRMKALCGRAEPPAAVPAAAGVPRFPSGAAVEERREARIALDVAFGPLQLYFGRDVLTAARDFVEWERASREEDCRSLPALADVQARTDKLLQALRLEVVPKEFRK